MSAAGDASYRRYRRRILGWGAVGLVVVFVVGAVVTTTRVEDDLEGQVIGILNDAGIAGTRVTFSGQDGELTCATALPDPDTIVDRATAVRGVRSIELADGCIASGDAGIDGAADEPPTGDGSDTADIDDGDADETAGSADATTDGGTLADGDGDTGPVDGAGEGAEVVADQTVLELIATDPQFSALDQAVQAAGLAALAVGADPYTAFAPSNEAFERLTPAEAGALNADPELFAAVLENHVAVERYRLAELPDGPLTMLGGGDVVVEHGSGAVDGAEMVTLTSGAITATVTDGDLVMTDGTLHVVDRLLFPDDLDLGLGDDRPTTTEPAGDDPGDDPGARAAALQIDLDGVVAATRIGFAPGSTEVSPLSGPTFARVAEAIEGRPGLVVVVRGHTDSGGSDVANLFVSQARAEAVVDALVARGVPRTRLIARGVGATEPVEIEGVEDPVASRRVDFVVETE